LANMKGMFADDAAFKAWLIKTMNWCMSFTNWDCRRLPETAGDLLFGTRRRLGRSKDESR
jgi:hypothetical protein